MAARTTSGVLTRRTTVAICVVVSLVCGGCARVEPWARGTLARDDMSIDHDASLHKLRDHAFISKEAAQGGHGGGGGGCGCN